ncbi:MAG TPA: BTAD domain-containing putative transcriptional regulator [Actinocrinis sp.]|nr:BTAD domain-containing putative transcriptional regulator [Actinocrinis sp.]
MAEVEYRLLGPVQLLRGGDPVQVGGGRTLTLLAGLLLSANQVVTGERLAEIVWGERQPARPRSALHSAVSRLRRIVGAGAIEGVPTGYRLNVAADGLDLLRSDRLVEEADAAARRGLLDEAAKALGAALGLWRGRPLDDIDSAALHADAARLAEKHLVLHERHAEMCLRLGRHAAVVELLPPLVQAQPFRERLVGQLMLALFRSGRQAEALAQYETLGTALHKELGILPSPWLRDLHVRILRADPDLEYQHTDVAVASRIAPLPHTEPWWRGLRPSPERLVGRTQDIDDLSERVRTARVVTVVGAPGVGKTSLALKAAERVAAEFRDGVAVVELGDARIVTAVRTALGLRTTAEFGREEALTAALRPMELLLVLDNAEHVAAESARVVDVIVRSCPGVRVLTTSRRPLGLGIEAVVELPPLESDLAAELLRLRVNGHRPRLDLSADADANALAELCRLVDGLPLAIELAAAQLRTMPLHALVQRIGRQRGLLAGPNGARLPHQRALDTTLQWSYDLLTRPARLLLHRLALFEDYFTLDEAEQSCAHSPLSRQQVAGMLGDLVEQSMVQALRRVDGYFYRLLRPVRSFVLAIPAPFQSTALSVDGIWYRRALTLVCAHDSAM